MARPSRATQGKRSRERAQQDKQQEKRVMKAERRERQKNEPLREGDEEDPDLAGIVAGPQPPPEWDPES